MCRGPLIFWISWAVFGGFIIIAFFEGQLSNMLKFAMSSAFVSAPVFSLLNYSLVRSEQKLSSGIQALSIIGLMFLLGANKLKIQKGLKPSALFYPPLP